MLDPDGRPAAMRETVDALYRHESRHIFAMLVRSLGDFDLAEEALHMRSGRRSSRAAPKANTVARSVEVA